MALILEEFVVVMTVTVMVTMMTMFPVVMTSCYKVFMKPMMPFRLKLNDSHLNNFLSNAFSWLREMTMTRTMFKHIQIRLQFFEIEYTMEALNNRKPTSDYL
ncbi:hypothetical protein HPL003_14610 [Paenibacillus terrae HPL-003]|uniref:Uncharacterized protein n=1 Tax=Paenibacillus terrae (strain HPL-003) TaxID=985665 RepID=G7W289_PAETH|nr:hypothetical protein HPL003_14610 [Paenibacillus terrae HPL-003]